MFLIYLILGLVAGFLAGLLGVGGGLVIVPVLAMAFAARGVDPRVIQHLALGTSLGSIILTGLVSAYAHYRRGAVNTVALERITPGIVAGTLLGTVLAAHLATRDLVIVFVLFEFAVGTQMLLGFRPKPERGLPGWAGSSAAGAGIGMLSSLVGIGGGTLSVPFLAWSNRPLREAVGTSAALGVPIALAGSLGYVLNGWSNPHLPPWSLGYLYVPALLGIVAGSVLTAPAGAWLAHRLPVKMLRRIFALLLYALAAKMAYSLL